MSFQWEKKGLIFDPTDRFEWMKAFSQVPTILEKENVLRIYFTTRPAADSKGQFVSHISYIDVDKNNPSNVVYIHPEPIMALGKPGSFDEFGIHPTGVIRHGSLVYLYYTGWMRGITVPYETWIGLAISDDDGATFNRYSDGPIIGKSAVNPYLANGAYTFAEGGEYKMVYAAATDWAKENNKFEPVYTLKSASSSDGINWQLAQEPLLAEIGKDECISRPAVVKSGGCYHIWYGYRKIENFRGGSNAYRIGYATSKDFKTWERKDSLSGIELSTSGWDSTMMSYPQIIQLQDQLIMFYNGNDFGRNSFGYATMDVHSLQ